MSSDLAPRIICSDLSITRVARGGESRVIDGVSFRLEHGAALALVGGTGSGKSTLASVLAGRGDDDVTVSGGDAVVEGLTVGESVAEPVTSRARKVNASALSLRVATLVDELGLALGATTKFPYELSAGMRQRVALARALMLDPALVIADEPMATLDIEGREIVRQVLARRQRENGTALVLVANDPTTVDRFDADVLVLRAGHAVGYGHGTNDILWTPSSEADPRLVSS